MGFDKSCYALHSVRIGYATALFEDGYDELVIRLVGVTLSYKTHNEHFTISSKPILNVSR